MWWGGSADLPLWLVSAGAAVGLQWGGCRIGAELTQHILVCVGCRCRLATKKHLSNGVPRGTQQKASRAFTALRLGRQWQRGAAQLIEIRETHIAAKIAMEQGGAHPLTERLLWLAVWGVSFLPTSHAGLFIHNRGYQTKRSVSGACSDELTIMLNSFGMGRSVACAISEGRS